MATDPTFVLGAFAAIIGMGYLGSLLFDATGVTDVLLLVALGVVLGPLLDILQPGTFRSVAPLLGTVTLLIILFEGGLSTRFQDLSEGLGRAGLLAVVGWFLSVVAVAAVASGLLGLDLAQGVLLGTILGGSSSIVIIPLMERIETTESVRVSLKLESALTDVLCVVGALAVLDVMTVGAIDPAITARTVAARFSVAIVLGLGAGLLWEELWRFLERGPYAYMVTLGMVLALHVVTEVLGGAGPIAVLAFGIILGNRVTLTRGRASREWEAGGAMRQFQEEVTFFVRTFFFVTLGVLLEPLELLRPSVLLGAVVLLVALVAARYAAVRLATRDPDATLRDRRLLTIMLPRGLAAAVLAVIPVQRGIAGTENFVTYAFAIIVLTNLLVTAGVVALRRGADPGYDDVLASE